MFPTRYRLSFCRNFSQYRSQNIIQFVLGCFRQKIVFGDLIPMNNIAFIQLVHKGTLILLFRLYYRKTQITKLTLRQWACYTITKPSLCRFHLIRIPLLVCIAEKFVLISRKQSFVTQVTVLTFRFFQKKQKMIQLLVPVLKKAMNLS